MAKKHIIPERNTNPTKTGNSPKIIAKNSSENRSKMKETANGDATSGEDEAGYVAPSSNESVNDEVADSCERRISSDEEEEEREEKAKSVRKRGKKGDASHATSAGKKRSRKEKEELEAEDKRENALYTFPMKRISQIIKSDIPGLKISQEAVFLINKASEKFLQLFSKEAYTCTFLDKKKQTAYNHLASVVSKRKRFEFLSDIVPEKVKVVDALALVEEAGK